VKEVEIVFLHRDPGTVRCTNCGVRVDDTVALKEPDTDLGDSIEGYCETCLVDILRNGKVSIQIPDEMSEVVA
jgi:ferredoxin